MYSTMYTAHSFRGTAASVDFLSGVSMKDILDTANWTSSKTFFFHFNHKDLPVNNNDFAPYVLDCQKIAPKVSYICCAA